MVTSNPFPYMVPKSTAVLLESFDPNVYTGTPDTVLYKFLDALCGNTGAGALVNQVFYANMVTSLQTIYFNDLDFIFGKISLMARSPSESYPYNPMIDQLTSYQWDEVMIKDAWYRARIVDFFKACSLGGTPDGLRMAVKAAIASDCDIYEIWRYKDNFHLTADLGRTPPYEGSTLAPMGGVGRANGRNEVVIQPHKQNLSPGEMYLLRGMLDRIAPIDTVVTVNVNGLSVKTPVNAAGAAATSTYFEAQQVVTATPVMSQMPPPAMLPIDLLPSQTWLYQAQNGNSVLAPYAAFNMSQQSSSYYLATTATLSPIDTVTYGTLQGDGSIKSSQNYQSFATSGQLGPATPYDKADSPDNYPGGKFGMHPNTAPALNADSTPYVFPYQSQTQYVQEQMEKVLVQGGTANTTTYRLPVQQASTNAMTFYPIYAIATTAPANSSTVTQSVTATRGQTNQSTPEVRDPINFVHPVLPSSSPASSAS